MRFGYLKNQLRKDRPSVPYLIISKLGVDLSPFTSPVLSVRWSADNMITWVELRVQSSAQIIYFYVKKLILQQYEVQSKRGWKSEMGGDENWDLISRFFEIEKILRSRDFWWSICLISEFLGILPSSRGASRDPGIALEQ